MLCDSVSTMITSVTQKKLKPHPSISRSISYVLCPLQDRILTVTPKQSSRPLPNSSRCRRYSTAALQGMSDATPSSSFSGTIPRISVISQSSTISTTLEGPTFGTTDGKATCVRVKGGSKLDSLQGYCKP